MSAPSRPPRVWLWIHLGLLALAAGALVHLNREQWFFGDEWDFFVNRGLFGAPLSLWVPHNEHWSTLPILVYTLLRNTFGLASYWPYITVLIAVHLTLTHLLWRVMLRSGVLPAVATGTAAVFSMLGAGSENLLWAFQIGFVGSVVFGWAAALVVATSDRRLGRRDVWGVLLLIGALLCSGVGVPMVVVAVVAVWISSRSLWRPLVVGGIPAIVFIVWYVLVGKVPAHPGTEARSLRTVASLVVNGIGHIAVVVLGTPKFVAGLVLVLLAMWCLWVAVRVVRGRPGVGQSELALSGVAGIAAFVVMIAFGRGALGSSRYIYIVVALGLPAVAMALNVLCRFRWAQAVVVVALVAVGFHNVQLFRQNAAGERTRETWIRDVVESSANLVERGEPTIGAMPEPVYDPNITTESLKVFVERNGLATTGTEQGTLAARLTLQIATIAPGTGPESSPVVVKDIQNVEHLDGAGSCVVPNPGSPGAVVVDVDGQTRSLLLRATDDGANYQIGIGGGPSAPPVRTVTVPKGQEQELLMILPAGTPDVTVWPVTTGSVVCLEP